MKGNSFTQLTKLALLAAVSTTILTGCGNRVNPAELGGDAIAAPGSDPTGALPGGDYGGGGSYEPNPWGTQDPGYTDLPSQPIDVPEPLPVPNIQPAQPGQPFTAKAVANTTAFAVPRFSKLVEVNGLYVHINLTWQPVQGAAEYWIYKDRVPDFVEARRETAYAIVPAGFASAGFKDGLEPPNLSGGSLWDKVKRGFKMVTNRPGIGYQYKVVAVDPSGIPMSESNVFMATALPAIPAPVLNEAQQTNTVEPLFTWSDGNQSNVPADGYFVSVFPSVQFTGGTLPPTGFAFWSTYRPQDMKLARYGKDSANLASYPGTLPFKITFDLAPSKNYSWTVLGVKTDTGEMKTASAISRAWAGFGHFQITPNANPVPPSVAAQRAVGTYRAPYPTTQYPRQPIPQGPRF